MQNNFKILFFLFLFISETLAQEQFAFDVTKIEISDNGNKIIGTDRGLITSNNGIIIEADNFEYNKKKNLLKVNGNVIINNSIKNYKIFSDKIKYLKNKNIISAENNIKIIDNDQRTITSNNILYNIDKNIFNVVGNVKIVDLKKNLEINSKEIKYFKNDEKIQGLGSTSVMLDELYEFKSNKEVIIDILNDEVHAIENVEFFDVKKNYRIISDEIHFGAMVFMAREYRPLSLFALMCAIALYATLGWQTSAAFVLGALCSGTAGYIGMFSATKANVRTAIAARDSGQANALNIAFFGGTVMGLTVAAMGLFGVGLLFYFY